MLKDPKRLWTFIFKVNMIFFIVQFCLTIAVAVFVVTVHPIGKFFLSSWIEFGATVVNFLSLLVVFSLSVYLLNHPINKLILPTVVTIISLTLYTFWDAKTGHDFKFLFPFLFVSPLVLLIFGLIHILHPLRKLSPVMIYGGMCSITFFAYISYFTEYLIKYSCEEFIWAPIGPYLDGINLFLAYLMSLETTAHSQIMLDIILN